MGGAEFMRVLLVLHRLLRGGGTETHFLTLAMGLRRMGHQVRIYTFGGPWVEKARSQGLAVTVGVAPSMSPLRARAFFSEYVRKNRFDIIHVHDGASLNVVSQSLPSLRHRPPLVFTVHGPYVRGSTIRRAKLLTRAVIAVSQPIRYRLVSECNVPARMVYTVTNGIPTDVFRPVSTSSLRLTHRIPKQAFIVGYAGRFTFDKRGLGARITQALRMFTLRHRDCYVLVAGRNAQAIVRATRNVRVLGHVSSMERFYNTCNVIIGTGRVAAEAIACGVPTLVIGKSGYHGILTKSNMIRMIHTNFGDHGIGRQWTDVELRNDLLSARRRIQLVRRETLSIRSTLLPRISSDHMVREAVAVYSKVLKDRKVRIDR